MRNVTVLSKLIMITAVIAAAGCEKINSTASISAGTTARKFGIYTQYAPARIDILPLTEMVTQQNGKNTPAIRAYVSLLDSSDCQIKAPSIFRFELYELAPRSAEPKGKRIAIWPDINLTNERENNNYWRNYLRAYEFNLDFEPQARQNYVLQITVMCPDGRQLSGEFALKK